MTLLLKLFHKRTFFVVQDFMAARQLILINKNIEKTQNFYCLNKICSFEMMKAFKKKKILAVLLLDTKSVIDIIIVEIKAFVSKLKS